MTGRDPDVEAAVASAAKAIDEAIERIDEASGALAFEHVARRLSTALDALLVDLPPGEDRRAVGAALALQLMRRRAAEAPRTFPSLLA